MNPLIANNSSDPEARDHLGSFHHIKYSANLHAAPINSQQPTVQKTKLIPSPKRDVSTPKCKDEKAAASVVAGG